MKLSKRVFVFLLAVILVFSLAICSSAKVVYRDAGWVFEYTDKTCREFQIDDYEGNLTSLSTYYGYNNIPIVSIAASAFSSNTKLKSISVNEPIKTISQLAFLNCTSLESVDLPATLSKMGYSAFEGCYALEELDFDKTQITSIPTQAFKDCYSLSKIVIPKSVISIADDAFQNDTAVKIYCYKNSFAHTYAVNKKIPFELLDGFYYLGDADGDGEVTIMDATTVQKVLASVITDTDGKIALRADMARNGLDITDATMIQRYLVKLDTPYAIGEKILED
ncbi:MAG: leucine-rich repeat protein [Oscillospiraceae bacterium]|nr:leucine-rich repeat protein [Candidatus Ruminococcus equi]